MTYVLALAGFAMLLAGGEGLVRGAVALAGRLRVSPLLIGLTVVGFGTSTPELVTSLNAALADAPGIAVGNVVGSNICNILLILGVAALIRPVTARPAAFRRDGAMLTLATLAGGGLVAAGEIGRWTGGVLLAALLGFVLVTYLLERDDGSASAELHREEADQAPAGPASAWLAAAFLAGGGAVMLWGADLLVDSAVTIARDFGVSDAVIGLTVVAVGTSLPELATSAVAALRGRSDVALGNIVGSNIFNLLGILGATALVRPLTVPPAIAAFDVWAMAAATGLLIVATVTGWRVNRLEATGLLALYALYLAVTFIRT